MWNIDFYRTKDNIAPVEEFLESLNIKMRAKSLHDLNILQQFGIGLREPHSKPVKNGIFELRIKLGSDISRIFYFFRVGNKIILTNGFIKKTKKTPKNEINKALNYKVDYEGRYGK